VKQTAKRSGNLARPDRSLEPYSRRVLPGRGLVRSVRRHVAARASCSRTNRRTGLRPVRRT
jgi:hypothetical protein